jgi:hypothetical protein
MAEPGSGWREEDRKELARNRKGKIVGTLKRLETFHILTHTEQENGDGVLLLHKFAGDIVLNQLNSVYMFVLHK